VVNSCRIQSFHSGDFRLWPTGLLLFVVLWLHTRISEEHAASTFSFEVRAHEDWPWGGGGDRTQPRPIGTRNREFILLRPLQREAGSGMCLVHTELSSIPAGC
jgi:hypothetical protein